MRHRRLNALALLVIAISVVGCGSDHAAQSPLIVAHRGASAMAPENTLAAFDLAWSMNADMIEGDFYLTSDGEIVCHHDESLEDTAGFDLLVEEATRDQLREYEVGRWKDPKWTGEPIPTLDEVLTGVPPGKSILIELKTDERIVPALAKIIEASHLNRDQMIVITFDAPTVAAVKARLPWIKAYWLSSFKEEVKGSGDWTPTIDDLIATAIEHNADGVSVNANKGPIDANAVTRIRAAGLEFHVWTVNDADVARRMRAIGAQSITTDRPGWLRIELQDVLGG